MPTMDDIYRKFGEAAEAAQLVETNLGTDLLFYDTVARGHISPTLEVDADGARAVLGEVSKKRLASCTEGRKAIQKTDMRALMRF